MTNPAPIPDFLLDDFTRLGLTLDATAIDRLAGYLGLLLDANTRTNLTAIKDPDTAWRRLITDSLTLLPGLEDLDGHSKVIDIGTGGGLPGVPLAIARPDVGFTLVDATGKKVAFLQSCVDALGLENVAAIQGRAEVLGHEQKHRQSYDLATVRAVGKVSEIAEYCLPMVRVGGRMLAMKGGAAEQELGEAGDALSILGAGDVALIDAYPEGFDSELVLISIVKDRPTPKGYPREPGLPRKTPL